MAGAKRNPVKDFMDLQTNPSPSPDIRHRPALPTGRKSELSDPIFRSPAAKNLVCQSACKFDPSSASNFDPLVRRVLLVALVSSELAGIAEARRARVA